MRPLSTEIYGASTLLAGISSPVWALVKAVCVAFEGITLFYHRLGRMSSLFLSALLAYSPPFMLWWIIVAFAIFLIGLAKSGFGSGAGLLIPPLTVLAMSRIPGYGAEAALGLLLPMLILGDVLAVYQYRRDFRGQIILRLALGTIIGVIIGSSLLSWLTTQTKELAQAIVLIDVGIESVFLVGLHFYRVWRAKGALPPYRPSLLRSTGTGIFAGVSSTLAHAAGPIISLHLLPQKLARGAFISTGGMYFFLLNSGKLPGYAHAGMFHDVPGMLFLYFAPCVVVGTFAGRWLTRRISDAHFARIVYTLTLVMGVYLLIKGLLDLRPLL